MQKYSERGPKKETTSENASLHYFLIKTNSLTTFSSYYQVQLILSYCATTDYFILFLSNEIKLNKISNKIKKYYRKNFSVHRKQKAIQQIFKYKNFLISTFQHQILYTLLLNIKTIVRLN